MGSPLAPILANIYMGTPLGTHENYNWLNDYNNNKPSFYRRYVDDIFAFFTTNAKLFYEYINTRYPDIKFTFFTASYLSLTSY